MSPFYSIIVPVYNIAPYLRECLDSILAQTFTDWECVCVDDGSTDESSIILEEYALKDSRFQIFHKQNGGVSSARNLALDNARGEWVWFVDGDDAIAPYALGVLHEQLNAFPKVQAITLKISSEHSNLGKAFDAFAQKGDCQFIAERRDKDIIDFSETAFLLLFHRTTIGTLRFHPYRLGEDGLFALEYYCKIKSWIKTDFKLYFYRSRPTSVCHEKITTALAMEWLKSFRARFYMLTNQKDLSAGEIKGYFQYAEQTYFYCHGIALLLTKEGLEQIFQPWHSLNCEVNSLVPFNFKRRLILALLMRIPSPRLMWLLVVKPAHIRSAIKRFRRNLFKKK